MVAGESPALASLNLLVPISDTGKTMMAATAID
jgi:hypothetical protein